MPRRPEPVDHRPQWMRDDENVEAHLRLTRADRALIDAGPRAALLSGGAVGVGMGFGLWVVVLLLRAVLGGGFSFHHWTYDLTAYAVLSSLLGFAMGPLRRWSNLGHRFRMMPMINVRAGWNTWLGLVAMDLLVIIFAAEANLGMVLVFAFFGLIWVGVLYDVIWTVLQDLLIRRGMFRDATGAPAKSGVGT